MLSVVNPQNISVNSSGKVIDGFASLNRKIKTRSDAGWIPMAFPYKVDVDQFFSRVGHNKILDALLKMINLWRGLHGRRREVIVVPRRSGGFKYCKTTIYTRSFKHRIRQIVSEKWDVQTRAQTSVGINTDRCTCVRVSDIMAIVMLDLDLGFCYYGSTLVKLLNVGVTQGVYIEYT